jgi:hypothetical protein
MISYDDLLRADLGPLRTAVSSWRQVPKGLAGSGGVEGAWNQVAKGLGDCDWTGGAADAARAVMGRIGTQIKDAADEAHEMANLLEDALHKFTAAQKALRELDRQINAPGGSMRLTAAGQVELKDPAAVADDEEAATYAYQALSETNQAIHQALRDATDADEALFWALNQDPNGSSPGFDPHAVSGIAAAEKERAKALRDADTAARLARKGAQLTDAQVKQLNRLLSEHYDDPDFGAEFATDLGAKGTLRFWASVSDPGERVIDDAGDLNALQKNLSLTLAAATRYHSPAMATWEKDMIALGDVDITPDSNHRVVGFQLMSSLMHEGTYDTGFLKHYGDALISADQASHGIPGTDWNSYSTVGSDGNGPLDGLCDALSRNPAAATAVLGEGDHFEDLAGKDWLDPKVGNTAFGRALMSATTGRLYNVPPGPTDPPHSRAEADLMGKAIRYYGTAPNGVPAGMRQNLGRMAAEYMPEMNNIMLARSRQTADQVMPLGDNAAVPLSESPQLDVSRFLFAVSQSPAGYAAANAGLVHYAASMISYHLANPHATSLVGGSLAAVGDVAEAGGTMQAILDLGRKHSIITNAQASDAAYNQSLSTAQQWVTAGVNAAITMGTDAIPVAGPIAEQVGQTVLVGQVMNAWTNSATRNTVPSSTQHAAEIMAKADSCYTHALVNSLRLSNHAGSQVNMQQYTDAIEKSSSQGISTGSALEGRLISQNS